MAVFEQFEVHVLIGVANGLSVAVWVGQQDFADFALVAVFGDDVDFDRFFKNLIAEPALCSLALALFELRGIDRMKAYFVDGAVGVSHIDGVAIVYFDDGAGVGAVGGGFAGLLLLLGTRLAVAGAIWAVVGTGNGQQGGKGFQDEGAFGGGPGGVSTSFLHYVSSVLGSSSVLASVMLNK